MDAPVSWLLIRPGWAVYDAEGGRVGEVSEVAGDDTRDIFNGLAVSLSVLGQPRYVLAESVTEITDGTVRLALTPEQVQALGEYREPATSAVMPADSRGGLATEVVGELRELESTVMPGHAHEQPMNIWRRLYLAVRRAIGR